MRASIALACLAAVPFAALLLVGLPGVPTPTQAALAGWLVWGVPLTALASSFASDAPVRSTFSTGFVGWGFTFAACLVAAGLAPGYPERGPHEAWCYVSFVAPVVVFTAWCGRRAHHGRSARARRLLAALAVSIAALGTCASFVLFADRFALSLPVTTHPILHASHMDMMGGTSAFVAAPMSEAQVRDYARSLGLTPCSSEAALPSAFAPDWFVPRGRRLSWYDPSRAARSSERAWSWAMVTWDGTTAWVTHGEEWL